MNIALINGSYLNPSNTWTSFEHIYIQDGTVLAIDQTLENFKPDLTIDASGKLLFPGLTDLSVSLREPGYSAKGTISSESYAAAAGGVTALCCTPSTKPVNDTEAVTKLIAERAEESGYCKIYPLGALTAGLQGEQLSEYAALKQAGCIALSSGYKAFKNLAIAKHCFEYAKTQELSVFVNPIEPSLHIGVVHESTISTTVGLQGIPSLAETIAVSQLIQLAKNTGVHLHFSQLSTADAAKQIAQAKSEGINITADVAIQNLCYTDKEVESFNSAFHCKPPLREESDRLALIAAVNDGTIDSITSAHRPHEAAAKQMPFAETSPGMSNIELLLPLANQLANNHELTLETLIRAMTVGSAKVLKQQSSTIEVGHETDLVLFDPNQDWHVSKDTLVSLGKNTPLLNKTVTGKVVLTLQSGRIVYQFEK